MQLYCNTGFNSMIVRLKDERPVVAGVSISFQFYDSPIKSLWRAYTDRRLTEFQFYDSPIKRSLPLAQGLAVGSSLN